MVPTSLNKTAATNGSPNGCLPRMSSNIIPTRTIKTGYGNGKIVQNKCATPGTGILASDFLKVEEVKSKSGWVGSRRISRS